MFTIIQTNGHYTKRVRQGHMRAATQQQGSISSFLQGETRGALRALQKGLQQAVCVHVSDQNEGLTSSICPKLTAQHRAV